MARGFGQYCPLALALEVLGERWTLFVVSRLADGCRRFNEIHRGIPRMSASLLAQRLRALEHAGILARCKDAKRRGYDYVLTQAGQELAPFIMQLAAWGQRWGRDMTSDDLDPGFLVWSMHLRMNADAMPTGRTVIAFEFTGAPSDCRRFWIVSTDGAVEMCLKHPGYEVDLKVISNLRLFIEAWRGIRCLKKEIGCGAIRLEGMTTLKRAFPDWLLLSGLATEERMRPGRERDLAASRRKASA